MEKVVDQTGAKTYQIADQDGNDLGVFRFIPSDAGILKRYKEAAAFFAGINDRIKGKDFEEILPELEKEAGEKIDLLFGAPVSEKFFKITSPFTVLESGETFAEQIITVIGGIIEKELAFFKVMIWLAFILRSVALLLSSSSLAIGKIQ